MAETTAGIPPRYLRTQEAARFLDCRSARLRSIAPTGPARLIRLGGRVVYAIEDLQTWADRGLVNSTSDPRGSVLPAKRQESLDRRLAGRQPR